MERLLKGVPPFKVFSPCGGCFPGIDTLEEAERKANETLGSRVVDSEGVVVFTSEAKPPPAA